jgi:hypothetical protein
MMLETGATRFAVDGREYAAFDERPGAWRIVLSETPVPVGPTLVEGRAFDSRDSVAGVRTAIVSESLAAAQWPNESAIGRRIDVSRDEWDADQRTVVGVVGDVKFDLLGTSRVGTSAIYLPAPQVGIPPAARIVVRYLGDERLAVSAMYEALERVDPTIVPVVESFGDGLERITQFSSTMMKLFGGAGAFAILLAITGIYGMSSNAVVLRSHEIGLRRALGASSESVVATFVRQGLRQLAVGLGASALLSAAVMFVVDQGFSLGAWTLTLLAAAVVLVVSACVLLSIYLAVRGVLRLEPGAALRFD